MGRRIVSKWYNLIINITSLLLWLNLLNYHHTISANIAVSSPRWSPTPTLPSPHTDFINTSHSTTAINRKNILKYQKTVSFGKEKSSTVTNIKQFQKQVATNKKKSLKKRLMISGLIFGICTTVGIVWLIVSHFKTKQVLKNYRQKLDQTVSYREYARVAESKRLSVYTDHSGKVKAKKTIRWAF